MRIAVIGVNHNDASVEIREKVAFCETKKIETVNTLLDLGINETIILSTCNRSEIYIVSKDLDRHIEETKNFYKEFFQVQDIENYLFVKKDHEAILHIYNVTAGLDSIVIGEDQILGQVKEALQSAMEVGCSKKILNKLFREAVTAAKQIKCTLGISEIPLSTSYIAIKNLKEELGTLKNKNILVIGAGKISSLALKYFEEEEVGTVYMINRTMHKIEDICKECKKLHIEAIDFKERYEIIKNVAVVFTATGATHLILKKDMMPEIDHELHIIDLAVPRDVEISIKENKLIKVYDIDDLKKLSDENLKKREILSEKASGIIENSIKDFYEWMKGIKFDPVIKSLNERCREIEEDTFDYISRKLELDCREKKIIEKMIKSSLKRLIREPINNLKDLNKEENVEQYIEMMNKLFNF